MHLRIQYKQIQAISPESQARQGITHRGNNRDTTPVALESSSTQELEV